MTAYTGRFEAWAVSKEGALNKDIAELFEGITKLDSNISRHKAWLIGAFGLGTASVPALSLAVAAAGPWLPVIAAVGLVISMGATTAMACLAAKITGWFSSPHMLNVLSLGHFLVF